MIHPVILSGGSGTRLWPMSRSLYPKQLLALVGEHSLLQETARRVMAELLVQLPQLDGILSANDVMSLGIISVMEAAGLSVPVIGVNALPEAIISIKAGKLLATVDFDALKIACIATEAAIRHLRGETVPAEIILPVQVVDRTNYQPWDRPLEERECPRWNDIVR